MNKTFITLLLSLIVSFPIFSQSGKYIEFDGQSRYMTIPTHDDFNVGTDENFTTCFWLYPTEFKAGSHQRWVAKRNYSNKVNGYELWGCNNASQFYAINAPNGSGNVFSAWSNATGQTNVWTHIAMVIDRNANKIIMYVNGEKKKESGSISGWSAVNNYDVFVGTGQSNGNPGYYFKGKMDNLRFYKKALSKEELQADMTSTVTASTDGLVAGYDFENIADGTAIDVTGNHNGTLFNFPTEGNITIKSTVVSQDVNFTGRGNDNEEILKVKVLTNGSTEATINNIKLKMTGTTEINDVEQIKIYTTKSNNKFDPRNPTGKGAILLGTATPSSDEITVSTTDKLYSGTNYIWITYQIKETAKEGNNVDAEVVSITTENETYDIQNGNPNGSRQILLRRKLVLAPGDDNSNNYRIPAICTAQDGSLVTITDKRKNNAGDLPQDIDLVCKRSTDGGKTWSESIIVAQGTGYGKGFGDACLIKAKSGKLVSLFVGGPGYFGSTPSNPLRGYMITSTDNGQTWSEPKDITNQIYKGETSPKGMKGMFFGSGHGLCTSSGRLMAVIAGRFGNSNHNYVIYSDDEGDTWKLSNRAISNGDEAKVVELNNGDILMSSRTSGNRLWAKSTDGGITWGSRNSWEEIWGNACDADIIKYTTTTDGFDKNRMLHTLPNAGDRRNVTMWLSYDEGTSWPIKKTICEGTSAYSSITILDDGTIGVYLEEDGSVPYKMYFLNYSLEWLTNGADKFVPKGTELVETPVITPESGIYKEAQTVTITCETPEAEIYYTTDGTTPNTNANRYTAPFEVSNSITIKAIAVKDGMANSVVTSKEYTIGWIVPEEARPAIDQRYATSITTENADANINYTSSKVPASYYVLIPELIEVQQGQTFTLNLEGLKNQGDGLQWCQAIILVDWNRDFTFTEDERVAIVGNRTTDNGNTLLSISQEITVPNDASTNKPTRMRVIYTDGWRPNSYKDLGTDPVDKGRLYDFNIKIKKASGVENFTLKNVSLSPNPTEDIVNINFSEKNKYNIDIISLDGKILDTKNIYAQNYTLNLNNYQSSVYILHITDKQGKKATMRLIKK